MESNSSGVCVISLEAIDLNFLETHYKANCANSIPQWTENVLGFNKNKYFEFEVRKEEKCGDFEDKIKHIEYTTCHICASQVPKLFFTEHTNSVKHKINSKIANLAVQRLQKNVNHNEEFNKDEIKSFTYFCPVCVTVMDCKDKNSHELSIGHKNSVIVENFLKDFLTLYSNDEYGIVEDHSTRYNDTNCQIQKDNLNRKPEVSLKTNLERDVGIKDYITLLNKKFKIVPMFLKVVDNEFLEIETVDGSLVKVDYHSFHGFRKIGSEITDCTLCEEVFETQSMKGHIMNDNHMRLVSLPLKNKHCIREVNISWGHCVLCNLVVENTGVHELCNSDHCVNLSRFLIREKSDESRPMKEDKKTRTVYYDGVKQGHEDIVENEYTCNVIVNKDVSTANQNAFVGNSEETSPSLNLQGSISVSDINNASTSNQYKHFCSTCNVFISTNKNMKKHLKSSRHLLHLKSDFHYLMKEGESPDYLICRVCDENVNNTLIDVKNHVTSVEHTNGYKTLLNSNTIKKISEDRFFCIKCNEVLFVKTEIYHIHNKHNEYSDSRKGVDQNEIIDNVQKSVSKAVIPPDVYFCNICNVKVPNTKSNIEIHILGRPHKRKVNEMFELEKISTTKENAVRKDDSLTCKVVKTNVHDKEIAEDNANVTKKDTYYNLVKSSLAGTIKCLVCEVYLTDNESNITTHRRGINHVNNYEFITKTNKLEIDGNNIYCAICSTNISIGNEISHCRGKKHLKNVADGKNKSE